MPEMIATKMSETDDSTLMSGVIPNPDKKLSTTGVRAAAIALSNDVIIETSLFYHL